MCARLPSGARGLLFGLRLHLLPFFMYARNGVSDEAAHMRSLVIAFVAHQCDKNQNLAFWLILSNFAKKLWGMTKSRFIFDDIDLILKDTERLTLPNLSKTFLDIISYKLVPNQAPRL